MTDIATAAPIRRKLAVASMPADGLTIEIVADAAERESLARANDLPSVERFVAKLDVRHVGRDAVSARGRLEAEATRVCVVTLEPFVETIREDVDLRFSPEGSAPQHEGEDDDPPEPIVGGEIDLGAALSEFFTLGLDPYPRKPGAAFDASSINDEAGSPFAALKGLKAKEGDS